MRLRPLHVLALAAGALALAAVALAVYANDASAIPNVKHPNVTFAESGCVDSQWCLRLDSTTPSFTYDETIEWVITNPPQNKAPHRIHLQSFGSTSDLVEPGNTAYLVVRLNQGGAFAIYSDYRNDRALGMEGSFRVVDPTAAKKGLPLDPVTPMLALALAAAGLTLCARRAFERRRV